MELKDFLITPVVLIVVYYLAYAFRKRFTNSATSPYFIPALSVKIIGAISLGLIYQFYYDGGDTYNYFEQSEHVYRSIFDSPFITLKLLLSNGEFTPGTFQYSQHIYWFTSPSEYLIIKLTAFFGLFCFNTYSSIAVFFACLSFSGQWAAYVTFLKEYPRMEFPIAMAILFLPSVLFWGSGLMKDTIALTALGWLFYTFYHLLVIGRPENVLRNLIVFLLSFYVLYTIRVFILLSFLPPAIVWVFIQHSSRIKSGFIRWTFRPVLLALGLLGAFYVGMNITKGNVKYDISEIGRRTKINSEYLYRISLQEGGSAYTLGEMDGSISSMLKLAPKALVVTLFRPYIWEIRNSMMFLSAVEALLIFVLTLRLVISPGIWGAIRILIHEPLLAFCIVYSIILGIAVGLNSYNFGSLVRYKIQILPFFLSSIVVLWNYRRVRPPKDS